MAGANSVAHEAFDQEPNQGAGDTGSMKQLAIERWENEGGAIPPLARRESKLS